jgi:hypothetical protein
MLGPLFSAIDVARERLDSMLDAAKIRVCSVVNTDVADCLLSRYGLAAKAGSGRKLLAWKRSFFALSEVGPASRPQPAENRFVIPVARKLFNFQVCSFWMVRTNVGSKGFVTLSLVVPLHFVE